MAEAEGWANRFDDCIYQWEDDLSQLIPVIVLVPAEMVAARPERAPEPHQVLDGPPAPLRLVRADEYAPVPSRSQVPVERPPLLMSASEAAEYAARILREVEMIARRGDARLLSQIQETAWTCAKIESTLKKKRKW